MAKYLHRLMLLLFFVHIVVTVILLLRQPGADVRCTTFPGVFSRDDTGAEYPSQGDSTFGTNNFRRPNRINSEDGQDVATRLAALVERRSTAADPELIRLIVDMLDPPSTHRVKTSRQLFSTPQTREVDQILQHKRGGFFVEYGAFDGERSSSTLYLEQKRGWTGHLVEIDPYFYTQLIGKSRRAWSINACLSPQPHVTQVQLAYKESTGGTGELLTAAKPHTKSTNSRMVPCFPLQALLVALNQSTVDYFNLDVQGFELEVLQTIPFHELNIGIISVKYAHSHHDKQSYVALMSENGYFLHRHIHLYNTAQAHYVDDFIFVKKTPT